MTMKTSGSRIIGIMSAVVVLLATFTIYTVISSYRNHKKELMETNLELALAFDLAIRDYMAEKIRPRMYELEKEFAPEMMSTSYISYSIFEKIRRRFPSYILKFSSDNPRNPRNLAGPEEREILRYFRENPEESEWTGEIVIGGEKYLGRFRARLMEESCLRCHGDPGDAPATMLERYGSKAGFHIQVGAVMAMDTIAVPVENIFLQALHESRSAIVFVLLVMTAGLTAVYLSFRTLVSRRLTMIANHIVDAAGQKQYAELETIKVEGEDEISALADSLNILGAKLKKSSAVFEDSLREKSRRTESTNERLLGEVERHRRKESELKKSKEKLKKDNEFHRSVINSMSDPVAVINVRDNRIVGANRSFLDFYEKSEEEVLGRRCHEIIRGNFERCSLPDSPCPLEETIGTGKNFRVDHVHQARGGEAVPVEVSTSPIVDAGGSVVSAVLVIRDITAQKRAVETAAKALRVAEEASIAKSQFLANMSHELRTPLNGIIGMAELAIDTCSNEDQKNIFNTLTTEATFLLSVIDDVLDFSKAEVGRITLAQVPFDLRHLVEDIANIVSLQAERKGLEFNSYCAPDLPINIVGDPGRLRQILLNITANALKFTDEGEIFLITELEEDRGESVKVRFTVKDTGIGIAPEKQEVVYESFAQLDGSTTRRHGGIGLGIPLAQQLSRLMGGDISLESEVGRGSSFRVTAVFGKLEEERDRPALIDVELKGIEVLIVDDSRTSLSVLKSYLGLWGCRTTEATSGEEALSILQGLPEDTCGFGLIITDFRMKGLDGFALAEKIRAIKACDGVPIILLTSIGSLGDGKRCKEIGVQGYLNKPVGQEELRMAVSAVLGRAIAGDEKESWSLVSRHTIAEAQAERGRRILLAEDYPTIQQILLSHLRSGGHEIDLAVNGKQAVEFFRQKRYDLVLMDVQMPEMDGYQAVKEIREIENDSRGGTKGEDPKGKKRVPIVAVTAHTSKDDRKNAFEAGMDDFLAKPVKRRALLDVVEKWTGSEASEATAASPERDTEKAGTSSELSYIFEEFTGREQFLFSAIDSFVGDVKEQTAGIRQAVASGDGSAVGDEAHSIKGAAQFLSAETLAAVAYELEQCGRWGDLRKAPDIVDRLEKEIQRLEDFVNQQRSSS